MMKFVVIESSKKATTDGTYFDNEMVIFGPFKDSTAAINFCNARIQLLASEWHSDDGVITDNLSWKIDTLCSPQ
jgi:hypothetical protein